MDYSDAKLDVPVTQEGNGYKLTAEEVNIAIHYLQDVEIRSLNRVWDDCNVQLSHIQNGVHNAKGNRFTYYHAERELLNKLEDITTSRNLAYILLDELYQVFWHIMVFSDTQNKDRFYI